MVSFWARGACAAEQSTRGRQLQTGPNYSVIPHRSADLRISAQRIKQATGSDTYAPLGSIPKVLGNRKALKDA